MTVKRGRFPIPAKTEMRPVRFGAPLPLPDQLEFCYEQLAGVSKQRCLNSTYVWVWVSDAEQQRQVDKATPNMRQRPSNLPPA